MKRRVRLLFSPHSSQILCTPCTPQPACTSDDRLRREPLDCLSVCHRRDSSFRSLPNPWIGFRILLIHIKWQNNPNTKIGRCQEKNYTFDKNICLSFRWLSLIRRSKIIALDSFPLKYRIDTNRWRREDHQPTGDRNGPSRIALAMEL